MRSFFKEAMKTIKTTGTVKPSSPYLIRDSLKKIDFSTARTIVEFGPGDGCYTREIVKRKSPEAKFFSFELNTTFYNHCSIEFADRKNVHILQHSALDFDEIMQQHGIDYIDCVMSSLPLSLFKPSDTQILLDKVCQYLPKNHYFVQIQYSLASYGQLRRTFDTVELDFTVRNVPPSFIYRCKN